MSTICSINTAENYRGVVRAVTQINPSPRDELLEAAVHAVNAAKLYVRTGFMRRQFTSAGVETLVFVNSKTAKRLPAVETFMLFVGVEVAEQFLTSLTGLGIVGNTMPSDSNPFN